MTSPIDWAETQVGVTEKPAGSNRQPYGRMFGRDGEPWCAFFDGAAYLQAGTDLRKWCDNIGYTPNLLGDLQAVGFGIALAAAQPGALVFFHVPGGRSGTNHTGLLRTVLKSGVIGTIEGNTSPSDRGSQHNGGCVARKMRPAGMVTGVVQPPWKGTPVVQAQAENTLKALQVAIYLAKLCHLGAPGDTNPPDAVKILQVGLNRWADQFAAMSGAPNPPDIPVTGVWDQPTWDAVTAVQRLTGIVPDGGKGKMGTVDLATWNVIYRP